MNFYLTKKRDFFKYVTHIHYYVNDTKKTIKLWKKIKFEKNVFFFIFKQMFCTERVNET